MTHLASLPFIVGAAILISIYSTSAAELNIPECLRTITQFYESNEGEIAPPKQDPARFGGLAPLFQSMKADQYEFQIETLHKEGRLTQLDFFQLAKAMIKQKHNQANLARAYSLLGKSSAESQVKDERRDSRVYLLKDLVEINDDLVRLSSSTSMRIAVGTFKKLIRTLANLEAIPQYGFRCIYADNSGGCGLVAPRFVCDSPSTPVLLPPLVKLRPEGRCTKWLQFSNAAVERQLGFIGGTLGAWSNVK